MRPFALLIAVLLFCPAAGQAGRSLPEMLAIIDAGRDVASDDVKVVRFGSLLRQLSETYMETEQQIGDMTVTARKMLRDEGVEESVLSIMEAVNQIFPRRVEGQKYAEYVTAYVVLRQKGQSHDEALRALQGIVRSLLLR